MDIKEKSFRKKINQLSVTGLAAICFTGIISCGYINNNQIVSSKELEKTQIIQEMEPVCRHTASMCGLAYREKYEKVEIAFGPKIYKQGTINQGLWHAQARVKINEEWRWISFSKKENKCYLGELENFKETDSSSVEDYINYRLLKEGVSRRNFVIQPRLR